MSELSDYLREHLGDRVADDIVREAEKQGHQIDRSAVYSALKGKHAKRPREDTLAALAAGFGLDVRTLRQLAGKPAGELGPYVPTREAASLTKDQRVALDQLIRTIMSGEGGSSVTTSEPRKKSARADGPTRDDYTLATRRHEDAFKNRPDTVGEESQDDGSMDPA